MLLQAEKFARDIAATYDNTLYSGLPRTALVEIQSWLVEATITCRNVEKSTRSLPNLLRSLGYDVDVRNSHIERVSPTKNSILTYAAKALWDPMIGQAIGQRMAGHTQAADNLTDFVKALDRVLHGSDANTLRAFDEHFNPTAEYRARMDAMVSQMASTSV